MLKKFQTIKVTIFSKYDINSASTRYRFQQYFPFLRNRGVECRIKPLFSTTDLNKLYDKKTRSFFYLVYLFTRRLRELFLINSKNTDLVIIYTELIPYFPPLLELLLIFKKIPYVLDYDDAIFHQYDNHKCKFIRFLFGNKIQFIMKNAHMVITGNQYIKEYALRAKSKKIEIIPTVVDVKKYTNASYVTKNKKFTIVWIGSPSTLKYINSIATILKEICKDKSVKIRLIGVKNVYIPGVEIETFPWSEKTEIGLISECQIGIMPLANSPWERGKCGLKLIQYMACGLPVIASAVGVNVEIVDNGVNGYCVNSEDEWIEKMRFLRSNLDLLPPMGINGKKKVESCYSLDKYKLFYAESLESLITEN